MLGLRVPVAQSVVCTNYVDYVHKRVQSCT